MIKMVKIIFLGMLLFSVCAQAQEKNCDKLVSEYIKKIAPWIDAKGKYMENTFQDVDHPGSRVSKTTDKSGRSVFTFEIEEKENKGAGRGKHKITVGRRDKWGTSQIVHHVGYYDIIITLDENCNVFRYSEVTITPNGKFFGNDHFLYETKAVSPSGCSEIWSLEASLEKENPDIFSEDQFLSDDQIEQKLEKIEKETGTKHSSKLTTPRYSVAHLAITCFYASNAGMEFETKKTPSPSDSSHELPSSGGDGATKAQ